MNLGCDGTLVDKSFGEMKGCVENGIMIFFFYIIRKLGLINVLQQLKNRVTRV